MRASGRVNWPPRSKPVWPTCEAERSACQNDRGVFFEEWDDPLISGIGWVSELIETAGGIDVFADRANLGAAKDRVVTLDQVIAQEPDLIIGSWCGKKFRPEKVAARPDFEQIPAVRHGALHEIKSPTILQPGPAALTDGLRALQAIIHPTEQPETATM
jgi:iron complex transport system substrate-binding protein